MQFNALGDVKSKVQLRVTGRFPSFAAGRLYRTGPGGYKITRKDGNTFSCSHWFDGFTTIHRFELVQGASACTEVWYSSQSQVDETIELARETGRLDGITFGQKRDPCDTLYKKVKTMFEPVLPGTPNSMNIGVTFRDALPVEVSRSKSGEKEVMTVTTDNHQSKTFDAATLEPLGVTDQAHLHPSLSGPISAAHAATDPNTGDIFNFNLAFAAKQTYRIFRAGLDGSVEILAEVSGLDIRGAYIHSLFATPNFVILCIWPAYFRKLGIDILWARNLMDAMNFDANAKAVWLVVDRHHGRGVVRKFTSPAFFCFHTVNAWEEKTNAGDCDIICELVQFESADILQRFYYKNLVSDEPGVQAWHDDHSSTAAYLTRYKLAGVPLDGKRKSSQSGSGDARYAQPIMSLKSPLAGDLPRMNPKFSMKPHRYVWSVLDRGHSSFVDGLVKTDTVEGTSRNWEHECQTPGEPVFIPRPGAEEEDDGVVLSVVLDGNTGSSYLLCLDASTMEEMGRAEVDRAVGFGFHGTHIANDQH